MQWIGFTFMVDASRGVFVTGQIVDWTSHSNNSSSQNKCSVGVWTGFSTTLWQIGHINSTQTTQHRTAQYNSLVQWIQGNQTITLIYSDLQWSHYLFPHTHTHVLSLLACIYICSPLTFRYAIRMNIRFYINSHSSSLAHTRYAHKVHSGIQQVKPRQ